MRTIPHSVMAHFYSAKMTIEGARCRGKSNAAASTHLFIILWICTLGSVASDSGGTCLATNRIRERDGVISLGAEPYRSDARFALRCNVARALLSRGGSSSEVSEDINGEEWLKVKSVADVRSVVSEFEEILPSDDNSTESGSADKATDGEGLGATDVAVDEEAQPDSESFAYSESSLTFGASKPGDGSESDPDGIPARFLKMQKGHRVKAKHAFAHTLEWRAEHNVDTILWRPHPLYDLCKSIYPHYFPGRDILGNPILVQCPGLLDPEKAHKYNITMDQLLMDFVFALEYCWNILEPGPPDGIMTSVIDMEGVTLKHIRNGEMRDFILRSVHVISENYPQRSFRTLIINTPRWFGGLYNLIKPLLRESTKKKIEILMPGKHQDSVIRKYLGDASTPRALLSDATEIDMSTAADSDSEAGPNSLVEQGIRELVMRRLEESGMEMYNETTFASENQP